MTMTASAITLTDEQQRAARRIEEWAWGPGREFSLGGYAGTGKTTLVDYLRQNLGFEMDFLAPTGKAAHVLRSKGVPAETIHSFAFNFMGEVADDRTGLARPIFEEKAAVDAKSGLIVVDESSMVNEELAQAVRKHGLRILWVGDHGQLPPIGTDPGIMSRPMARLETIHRQAAGNPILALAHHVRTGGDPLNFGQPGEYADAGGKLRIVRRPPSGRIAEFCIEHGFEQVVCGFNKTRLAVNAAFRQALGYGAAPVHAGERLICLQNNRRKSIYNGMQFTVTETGDRSGDAVEVKLDAGDGTTRSVKVHVPTLGRGKVADEIIDDDVDIFDYGYCITGHKSQGSEWAKVLMIDEPCKMWSMDRWRYTVVTRAKERLVVVR